MLHKLKSMKAKLCQYITSSSSIFLFVSFFSLLSSAASAQITALTLPSFNEMEAVNFIDTNNGVVAGRGVFKTTNGGNNWTELSTSGTNEFNNCGMYDVKMLSANTIFLFGSDLFFKSVAIYKSTDGGTTWSANLGDTLPGSVARSCFFINSNFAVGVGDGGLIFRTGDGGESWSPVKIDSTNDLRAVYFTDATTGFAAGSNIILSTQNGGQTWSSQSFPGVDFMSVSFSNTMNGSAITSKGDIYHTLNGGASWFKDPGSPFTQAASLCATTNGKLLVASSMTIAYYDSYWNKFQPTDRALKKLSLLNDSTAYVAAKAAVYKISFGSSSPFIPLAHFTLNGTAFCEGKSYSCTNYSDPTNCKWYINNIFYSNQYNITYTPTGSGIKSIRLTVIGVNGKDSVTKSIYVNPKPVIDSFALVFPKDTVCQGYPAQYSISKTSYNTRYVVTANGATSSVIGNGSRMDFTIPSVDSSVVISVKAITVTPCDTVISAEICDTLHVIRINLNTYLYAQRTAVCKGDTTTIVIPSPQLNAYYRIQNAAGLVLDSVWSNGNIVRLRTGPVQYDAVFDISTRDRVGCINKLNLHPKITISVPSAKFRVNNDHALENDVLKIDVSALKADSTFWQFDSTGASISSSQQLQPLITYNLSGEKKIRLISKTTVGCVDTMLCPVYIYKKADAGNGVACDVIIDGDKTIFSPPSKDTSLSITNQYNDKKGNIYLIGFKRQANSSFSIPEFPFNLKKYAPSGKKLLDLTYTDPNQLCGAYITAIHVDDDENIYLSGSYGTSSYAKFYWDNKYYGSPSLSPTPFVTKMDAQGNLKWLIYGSNQDAGFGCFTDMAYDGAGYLYLSLLHYQSMHNNPEILYFTDGKTLTFPANVTDPFDVIKIDTAGKFIKQYSTTQPAFSGYYPFMSYYNPHSAAIYSCQLFYASPKIKFNALTGNLYCKGLLSKKVTFDDSIEPGPQQNFCGFISILDTASNWKKSFITHQASSAEAIEINRYNMDQYFDMAGAWDVDKNGDVILYSRWKKKDKNDDPIWGTANNQTLPDFGGVLQRFSPNGDLLFNHFTYNEDMVAGNIVIQPSGDFILTGSFSKTAGFKNETDTYSGVNSKGKRDIFWGQFNSEGKLKWMRALGSDTTEQGFLGTLNNDILFISAGMVGGKSLSIDNATITNTNNNLFILKYDLTGTSTNCSVITEAPTLDDEGADNFMLFPNPTSISYITLKHIGASETKQLTLSVYDICGKEILKEQFVNLLDDKTVEIPVSSLPSGIFIMKIKGNEKEHYIRFVKL